MFVSNISFEFNTASVKGAPGPLCAKEERRDSTGAAGGWPGRPWPHSLALRQATLPVQAVLRASPGDPSHLWGFLERFTIEAAYSSAIDDFIVSCGRLIGLPFELSTVTGLMSHLVIWRLVLGLGFDWFHRLDIRPCFEFVPVSRRKHKQCETTHAQKQCSQFLLHTQQAIFFLL